MTIIILGYVLRRTGFFKEGDFHVLSKIALKITLPAAIVSSFTLPFVQGFLGPMGVVTTSLFDTGNAVVCLGGAYSAVNSISVLCSIVCIVVLLSVVL